MIDTEIELQTLWGWKFARDIGVGELLFRPDNKTCKVEKVEIIPTDAYKLTMVCRKGIARTRIIMCGTQKVVTPLKKLVMVRDLEAGQQLYRIRSNQWEWVVVEIQPMGEMQMLRVEVEKNFYVLGGGSIVVGDDRI